MNQGTIQLQWNRKMPSFPVRNGILTMIRLLVEVIQKIMATQPTPPRATYPPEIAGLIKGLLTIGFP